MTAKKKVNPKEEFMVMSDDDCETVYGSYEEEVERQMRWVVSHPESSQTVRVFELIATAVPITTITYK
jgi:hypothetical protein